MGGTSRRVTLLLESPHPFPERVLLFGGGGAGKTYCCLRIAQHIRGRMHVVESDFSMAWKRAIATEFPDVEDRVVLYEVENDWEPWTEVVAKVCAEADPDGDWVVIDSITPSWDAVQDWFQEMVYGTDVANHMRELKAQHPNDASEYGRAVLETMNWPLVKKEYQARAAKPLMKWPGNLVVTAEAKALPKKKVDDEDRLLYGVLGVKPAGYTRLHHLAATNLFLSHPAQGEWEMSTIKDRNREEQWRLGMEDFAVDYLMGVAGWKRVKE